MSDRPHVPRVRSVPWFHLQGLPVPRAKSIDRGGRGRSVGLGETAGRSEWDLTLRARYFLGIAVSSAILLKEKSEPECQRVLSGTTAAHANSLRKNTACHRIARFLGAFSQTPRKLSGDRSDGRRRHCHERAFPRATNGTSLPEKPHPRPPRVPSRAPSRTTRERSTRRDPNDGRGVWKKTQIEPARRRGIAGAMTTTVVHAATTVEALVRDDEAEAMDVDEPHVDSVAEEIILAAYRKDAVTVAECLKRCTPEATAEMSLSRAAAVELLGEDVYLGSHSWSTQEGFPVMYFAGANPGFRRRATHAPAPPSEGRGARHLPRFRFFPRKKSPFAESPRLEPLDPPVFSPRRDVPRGSLPARAPPVAPTTLLSGNHPSRRRDTPSRAPRASVPRARLAEKRHGMSKFPRQLESSVDAIFCHVEVFRLHVFPRDPTP